MRYIFALYVISIIFFACESKECCDFPPTTCYSFDVRQCQTDLFADAVSEDGTDTDKSKQMNDWLGEKGVNVHNIRVVEDFHTNVCEACDICPVGPRYYIAVYDDVDSSQLNALRLLNLQVADCNTVF